jgi:hypothetical protein
MPKPNQLRRFTLTYPNTMYNSTTDYQVVRNSDIYKVRHDGKKLSDMTIWFASNSHAEALAACIELEREYRSGLLK